MWKVETKGRNRLIRGQDIGTLRHTACSHMKPRQQGLDKKISQVPNSDGALAKGRRERQDPTQAAQAILSASFIFIHANLAKEPLPFLKFFITGYK